MDEKPLQYCKFMIDEKPYCLWDWALRERTIAFLDGVDPGYFIYLANVHNESLEGKEQQFAALAIRASYAQGLETLFAFLGAAIQAPDCVPAWLAKYQNSDLNALIEKISKWRPIYSSLGYRVVSWEQVADLILMNLVVEDKEKEQTIKRRFGVLWSRFAGDFLDEKVDREYNSIKHGFRVKPGGFTLALGIEEQPGVPAPPENMRVFGKSDFGSSFLIPEPISDTKEDKHHIRLKRHRLNWNPQDMLYGLHLIAMSLTNIIAYLKVANGVDAEAVQFQWLSDADGYHEPWQRRRTMGIHSMGEFEYTISQEIITKYTKEEIRAVYEQRNPQENMQ